MSVPPDKAVPAAPAALTAEEKLEKILKEFQDANKTATEDPGKNLRELLDKSPDLKKRILDSVDKGHLEHFALLPSGANAGGTYNSGTKTIELPGHFLNKADTNKTAAAELVFVMGHEIQHSFNSTASTVATDAFKKEVDKIAKGPGPHDYTDAIKGFIDNFRKDEAGAHIGGFNAIASQVLKDNPKLKDDQAAALKAFYNAYPDRMGDFIERSGKAPDFKYELKPGLSLDKDMTMPASKENVEAMGTHYFGKPASVSRLGVNGNQDYTNYYGDWAMGHIQRVEKREQDAAKLADPKHVPPEVKVNLGELGLQTGQLTNGLKYTDATPKKPIESGPDAPIEKPSARAGHPLYDQAFQSLEKLNLGVGSTELGNLAAAMAVKAQQDGLSQIDSVVKSAKGDGLIAVQGDSSSEAAKRSAVDRSDAIAQPSERNLEVLARQQVAPTQEIGQEPRRPSVQT